jgi:predicted aldo/keto reductase-like oxidoreductase
MNRRGFIGASASLAGAALLSPKDIFRAPIRRKSAADLVPLGKTGIKMSRLGIGTGSNGGAVQRALGQEGFTRLIRHAYDQGITYIDTAQNYKTHEFIRAAIKGLPREKLFIQTKMPGKPEKPLEVLDRYRQELGVDYLDSVLTHCATKPDWDDDRQRVLDALDEAKEKQIIRVKGVSCHGLPALRRSAEIDWVDVHLVRLNPQGRHIDGPTEAWNPGVNEATLPEAEQRVREMRKKGHGIIGMKIIGNGEFKNPEDREKSIRYAMKCGLLDSIVIGFANTDEIDEAIERMNRALAS